MTAEPGTFRAEEYQNPTSSALMPPPTVAMAITNGPGIAADSNGAYHGLGDHMNGVAGGIASGSADGVIGGPIAKAQAFAPQPKEFDRLEQYAKLQNAPHAGIIVDDEKKDSTQALLDTFRAKSSAGKVSGILPVNVTFPEFGPSIYLVSELTSENQAPAAEFSIQREKKGGSR